MRFCKVFGIVGLAALCAMGCENKTTTTGSANPSGATGKSEVKKLTLKAAAEQTIKQGGTDELAIKIDRSNFNDPVTIRLNDLPKGVTCDKTELVIPAGSNEVKVTLKAAADAETGDYSVKIDAQAPGIDENVQTLKLTVKDKG